METGMFILLTAIVMLPYTVAYCVAKGLEEYSSKYHYGGPRCGWPWAVAGLFYWVVAAVYCVVSFYNAAAYGISDEYMFVCCGALLFYGFGGIEAAMVLPRQRIR
jgi:hypothetical protein